MAAASLGNNAHLFAKPHRRPELNWLFDTVLECGPVTTVQHPGMAEPMLLVRFPGGGALSIEFTENAEDADEPRHGLWLELRADDPPALMHKLLRSGVRAVEHPGHPYYFMAPGGQVFTIASASESPERTSRSS